MSNVDQQDLESFVETVVTEGRARGWGGLQLLGLTLSMAATLAVQGGISFREFVRSAENGYRTARHARNAEMN